MLPQIKLKLKKSPMGTIARRYTRPVILTVFRPSSKVVVRARIWVIRVANTKCHVVKVMAVIQLDRRPAEEGQCVDHGHRNRVRTEA